MKCSRKMYTLVELCVTITAVALLMCSLFYVLGCGDSPNKDSRSEAIHRSMREEANRTKCKANLKNLAIASSIYTDDFGSLPLQTNNNGSANAQAHAENLLWFRTKTRANDASLYVCPSDSERVEAISDPRANHRETEYGEGDATVENFKNYISYAYFTGKKGNKSMGTVDNSSAIIADGYYGDGTEDATAANGWNHDEFGNWLRKDQGIQEKSSINWYKSTRLNDESTEGYFNVQH